MNICSIGRSFVHRNVSEIDFNSTRTILEFDAVFHGNTGEPETAGREVQRWGIRLISSDISIAGQFPSAACGATEGWPVMRLLLMSCLCEARGLIP